MRVDCGMPPLAQPVGGILAGQAVLHVLSARRWAEVSDEMRDYLSGVYGTPPHEWRPRRPALAGAAGAAGGARPRAAARARVSPPARRTCCWWRCSARTPSRLLATLRGRTDRDEPPRDGASTAASRRASAS